MLKILSAWPKDAPDIAHLQTRSWQDSYRGSWTDHYLDHEAPQERLSTWTGRFETPNDKQLVLLARAGEQLCGFACTYLDHDPQWGAFMDNLHVLKEYQKRGIGRALMEATAKELIQREQKRMYLWVLETNEKAILFYEKLGGVRKEKTLYNNPDGRQSPIWRYVWADVRTIL